MKAILLVVFVIGCGAEDEKPHTMPPKRPNNELIIDQFEKHPPQGSTAMRFRANGQLVLAKDRSKLDDNPPLASGTWELDKDQLTIAFDAGDICPPEQKGVYKVVLSKLGIRFTKVDDDCEGRHLDGSTFWRIK